MGKELRKFPRLKADIKIAYEIVKWNEYKLDKIRNPNYAYINDISVSGMGLSDIPNIKKSTIKALKKDRKKIRLAIFLYKNTPPLMTYARMIWSSELVNYSIERCGFVFLDVTPHFFAAMDEFINSQIK